MNMKDIPKEEITQEEILEFFVKAFKVSNFKAQQMRKHFLKNAADPNSKKIIEDLFKMVQNDNVKRENWRWKTY